MVEGRKSVAELLHSDWQVESILFTDQALLEGLDTSHLVTHSLSPREMKDLSSLQTPPGLLAIVKMRTMRPQGGPWSLALDGIRDPGNLGTILRIADWYGIRDVYCSNDTVELYNPKVIQGSMGSFLRVSLMMGDLRQQLAGKQVFATLLEGESIRKVRAEGGVLLVGGESNGIRAELLDAVPHTPITIPGGPDTESLNAAVATAICCERLLG